jgi:copper chaperone CopZ
MGGMMRLISVLSILLIFCISCKTGSVSKKDKSDQRPVTVELAVTGMHCMGCVETVRYSIAHLEGVDSVSVSLEQANAIVTFNPGKVDTTGMREAVELNGYKVTGAKKIGE